MDSVNELTDNEVKPTELDCKLAKDEKKQVEGTQKDHNAKQLLGSKKVTGERKRKRVKLEVCFICRFMYIDPLIQEHIHRMENIIQQTLIMCSSRSEILDYWLVNLYNNIIKSFSLSSCPLIFCSCQLSLFT